MNYVLFEHTTQKWLELIPGNARFHSSIDRATRLAGEAVSGFNLHALFDQHNIDWYARTIEVQDIRYPKE